MEPENISNIIKKIRKDNNLTQRDLANELNVTYQAVSKWENAKGIPDISTLKIISEKYHIRFLMYCHCYNLYKSLCYKSEYSKNLLNGIPF